MSAPTNSTPPKQMWMVIHHHCHGESVGIVRASECPSDEAATEALGFSYEKHRPDEWVEIEPFFETDIVDLP